MAIPSREEVRSLLAEGFNTIAFTQTLQLDRETPVSIYQRFAGGRAFFCLLYTSDAADE